MDAILIAVTIGSLVAATGFGAFAWHLSRQERRRSAARVAALTAAIQTPEDFHAVEETPVRVSSLFEPETSERAGFPLIKAAVGVAMALMLIVAIAMSTGGTGTAESTVAGERQAAPLELVAMRHTRNGDTLTVSGLVRNPRAGTELRRVSAIVFAFDRSGTFVASGRAPLDFVTLEPGDESPFLVTIPGLTNVGRYRVSFRTDSGVVRHVDRRADSTRLAAALQVR
jgi:hypothetical protein